MVNTLLEIMYIICGLVLVICGVYALNDSANPKKNGTAAFWIIFGIIFYGWTIYESCFSRSSTFSNGWTYRY